MFGRIADAVLTLLRPSWDAQLRRQKAELVEMISMVDDVLEKLAAAQARDAKRRYRAEKQEAAAEEAVAVPVAEPVAVSKTELWRRAAAIQTRRFPLPEHTQ